MGEEIYWLQAAALFIGLAVLGASIHEDRVERCNKGNQLACHFLEYN